MDLNVPGPICRVGYPSYSVFSVPSCNAQTARVNTLGAIYGAILYSTRNSIRDETCWECCLLKPALLRFLYRSVF